MEIRGSDGRAFVRLTPLFRDSESAGDQSGAPEPAHKPRLYCACAMAAHRFAGASEPDEPMVRIAMARLRRFVEEVRLVERDRRGTATLTGPQLQLALSIYDRAGHARLFAALTDHQVDGEQHVALSFELDPTTLPTILTDLEEVLAFPALQSSGRATEH